MTPEEIVIAEELTDLFQEQLKKKTQLEVFINLMDCAEYSEIAEDLGKNLNNTKQIIHRTRNVLKRKAATFPGVFPVLEF